jgi:hypothetical protein
MTEATTEMVIDAICGAYFPIETMAEFERIGLARFTGTQYNPDWRFIREKLAALTPLELSNVYYLRGR